MEKAIQALLLDIHSAIEEAANYAIEEIKKEKYNISYPNGINLLIEEQKSLSKLRTDPKTLSALRKVLLDVASYPVFHLFSLMDGVADPQDYNEFWPGVKFGPRSENDSNVSNLHDEFYATYEEWEKSTTV